MSLETRHKEKDILFLLLRLSKNLRDEKEIKEITAHFVATMEPEDVELVKKQVLELEAE